jgi:capsule polysaccharide export protein KpsE/RkpR
MKKILAVFLFSTASLAFAHNCPNEMKAIDAKLNSAKDVSPNNMTKIKALRAEGEKLHKEGKHDESMKSLGEAKKLLGI